MSSTDQEEKTAASSEDGNARQVDGVVDRQQQTIKPGISKFTRWYRSPLFNVILVGLIAFTQFGIWGALNYTGAGGQQEPYLVNGANSLTFGILANKIGIKWVLMIGTLGYAPYSASLYVNNRYGTEWFVLVGGATCGIAASALWATEGAIALGYGDIKDRGKFTGIWLGLRELGQLIGASISLSLNVSTQGRGKVGYTTYLVLISLQCLGLPLAWLISSPEKVIKSDGTKLKLHSTEEKRTAKQELKKMWSLLKRKQMFLMIPILIGFQWNSTYLGIHLAKYFSVRSRTLGALVSGIVATFANIFWGWFFDLKMISRPRLAKICWLFFVVLMLGTFSWQVANEKLYAESNPRITLDWENPGFGRGFGSVIILRFLNESHYMFTYWLVGAFFDDLETLTLAVGIVRSFESIGSCIAFGVGASTVAPMVNLVISFAMYGFTIPATTWVVWLVPERPVDIRKAEDGPSKEEMDAVVISRAAVAVDGPHP
ncbi:major facilitator superfamily domain-containing protein [Podospora didyma]|uniref:Major facilitator superfamily domain-containing protein n=1 Tax=Podospora didyma TaxID=330526 RepID=A0AAE0P0D3_9PEZI|nr:major facilitator superfamily domain-containing protein [Podospora didyma]